MLEPVWLPSWVLNKTTTRELDNGDLTYLFGVDQACFPAGVKGSQVSTVPEANGREVAGIQRDSLGGGTPYVGSSLFIINDYVRAKMGEGLWKNGKQGSREDIRGSEIMMQRNWYTPGGTRWYDQLAYAVARSEEAKATGKIRN